MLASKSLKDGKTDAPAGIARYCIKVPDYEAEVRKVKERGSRIYVEQQKGQSSHPFTWVMTVAKLETSVFELGRFHMDLFR